MAKKGKTWKHKSQCINRSAQILVHPLAKALKLKKLNEAMTILKFFPGNLLKKKGDCNLNCARLLALEAFQWRSEDGPSTAETPSLRSQTTPESCESDSSIKSMSFPIMESHKPNPVNDASSLYQVHSPHRTPSVLLAPLEHKSNATRGENSLQNQLQL